MLIKCRAYVNLVTVECFFLYPGLKRFQVFHKKHNRMVGIKLYRQRRTETVENRICYSRRETSQSRMQTLPSPASQPSRDTWTHTEHNYTTHAYWAAQAPTANCVHPLLPRGLSHVCVTRAASGKRCGIEFRQILSSHRMQHNRLPRHAS